MKLLALNSGDQAWRLSVGCIMSDVGLSVPIRLTMKMYSALSEE